MDVGDDGHKLRQALRGWQIFFIVFSVIIGEGLFSGDGKALEVAGPGGTLIALFLVALIAICVMEGLSELVQLYPAPNSIVEYIRSFVDEDLAWVCGIAYWYTWASIVATLNLTAATFTDYWQLSQAWQIITFYFIAPFAMLGINMTSVMAFGVVETIGGILKLVLIVGTGIAMYHLYASQATTSSLLDNGIQENPLFVKTKAAAVCWSIPTIAHSFLGVETVTVTAFEAKDSRSLRFPSRAVAYFISLLYFFSLIAELLVTSWTSSNLPAIYSTTGSLQNGSGSSTMPVAAAEGAGWPTLAGFLNGCYIFSVLSASNSALYVASRTLYGLTRGLPSSRSITRTLRKLSTVFPQTRTPARALLVSMLFFFWVPFAALARNGNTETVDLVLEIMEVTAAASCLVVWAVLSLAYIRYLRWLKLCDAGLQDDFAKYRRSDPNYKAWTLFSFIQPVPAYIGLIGSILTVCVFPSAQWWNSSFSGQEFAIAYGAPIVILLLWVLLKLVRRYTSLDGTTPRLWWVPLDDDAGRLQRCIGDLTWLELEPGPRGRDAWPQSLRAALRRRRKPAEDPDPPQPSPPCDSRVDSHELDFQPNGTLHGLSSGRPNGSASQHDLPAEEQDGSQDGSAHAIRVVDTNLAEAESGRSSKEHYGSVGSGQREHNDDGGKAC